MKNILSFLSLFLISLGSISAQTFLGKLNPYPVETTISLQNDTLKILAVMVEFQPDQDAATFGNGKFGSIYSQDYGNTILDPLPHDKNYFENHLEFVRNYYNKISNSNVNIEYTVLDNIITVSQTMRNYSPPPRSDDFLPLGNFSKEVWTLTAQANPSLIFSEYDVFLIFHAGVGRDISLPGSLGNERDLPSVYLSDRALREILNNDLTGLPVNRSGNFNTMIMPETESRELTTITGTFLFQITINGLLVASVASHLGLPDLFNTETGLSAIGRFGLMDGQSIFAYNGTYPPEPSAWEKIYLGWAEPVTISPGDFDISLVTKLAATLADTVILKVPLNSSEYYLIENRNRDANQDGSTVSYKIGDVVFTKTFTKDTTGYRSFDTDSLAGVIIDVDEFDWALPGSGILIWHIDDNVIQEKLASNKINTDKNRRGVKLVEADGIPDIGERFFTIFGDEVIGEGTQEDLWYSSNPSELYQNRFAKDTRPSTRTNTGANSLITISNFTDINNRMNFRITFGDSIIKPLFSFFIDDDNRKLSLTSLALNSDFVTYYLLTDSSLFLLNKDGIIEQVRNFSKFKTAAFIKDETKYVYGVFDSTLNIAALSVNNFQLYNIDLDQHITAPPIIVRTTNSQSELIISTYTYTNDLFEGKLIYYDLTSDPVNPSIKRTVVNPVLPIKNTADGDFYSYIGKLITMETIDRWLYIDNFGSYEFTNELPISLISTKDSEGNYFSVIMTNSMIDLSVYSFYSMRGNNILSKFSIHSNTNIESFALADLRQDGSNYLLLNTGNKTEVYNLVGSLSDNFPFTEPAGIEFTGVPLAADFEGSSNSEIISTTKDGRIFAIDGGTGKPLLGFPISSGSEISITPVLSNYDGKTNLAVIDDNNVFSVWAISSAEGILFWSEMLGNPGNTSFIVGAKSQNRINEFFPKNRAYNYPNPVYDGQTFIRYYVSEESRINIKIFDLAGSFVAEMNDLATAGMDNETLWDVSNIQSGVYLARIEAVSKSGKSESQVIKIAVVK